MVDGQQYKMKLSKTNKITILCEKKKWLVDRKNKIFSTHFGNVNLDEISEKEDGHFEKIDNKNFFFFIPTIYEFITKIKRKTQIIYPKDISIITFYSDVKETDNIIEAGTGSGALLISLARIVKKGKIISIERNKQFQERAIENIKEFFGEVPENIEFFDGDVYEENFDLPIKEKWADKIFLDLPEPWKGKKLLKYLRNGGILVNYNPQIMQIRKFIEEIDEMGFTDIKVIEIIERQWLVDKKRTRPADLMRGHTGFIMFARKYKKEG